LLRDRFDPIARANLRAKSTIDPVLIVGYLLAPSNKYNTWQAKVVGPQWLYRQRKFLGEVIARVFPTHASTGIPQRDGLSVPKFKAG
jgi:hypothetical protein